MKEKSVFSAILLGGFVCIGLMTLGYQISKAIIHIKSLDRTVTVKGLSEREVPADIAICPITFQEAGQGQFSIGNRDNYTPYVKKVRVVSTIEYYLSD